MKKRKTQSGKSTDQKLDNLTGTVETLKGTVDNLTVTVDNLAVTVDNLAKSVERITSTMATKDDLKGFATKDDLKGFATKDDLKGLEAKMVSRDHFDRAVRQLVTKVEFDDFKGYIFANMYTKDEHSDFLSMMDPMMLEFRNAERVNKLTGNQLCDMDDKIHGFDKRLKWLERGRILED